MATIHQPSSWLLLEQEKSLELWGIKTDGKIGFYWLMESGVVLGNKETGLPNEWDSKQPFVCIVSLPGTKVGAVPPLPEPFWQAVESSEAPVGVWCHYGGNLDLAEIGTRWNTWEYLNPACRKRFESILGGFRHPLPFSAGLDNLPWHLSFKAIKQFVRNRPPIASGTWSVVYKTLSTVWTGAHDQLNLEQEIRHIKTVCPIAFSLIEIKRRLELCDIEIFEKARFAGQLSTHMGVSILATRSFSEQGAQTDSMRRLCGYIAADGRALFEMFNGSNDNRLSPNHLEKGATEILESFIKLIGEFEEDWNKRFTLLNTSFTADARIPKRMQFSPGGTNA